MIDKVILGPVYPMVAMLCLEYCVRFGMLHFEKDIDNHSEENCKGDGRSGMQIIGGKAEGTGYVLTTQVDSLQIIR